MTVQPGYDVLASAYDEAFPTGYGSEVECHAVALFAEDVATGGPAGQVVDVGCGTGHITSDLAARGLDVVGVDPSPAMLDLARQRYPHLPWRLDDAHLTGRPDDGPLLAGVLARYSLIHVDPQLIPDVLAAWSECLQAGGHVMVAFQCSDDPAQPVIEFDHHVARAWRWHPDAMADALASAGLAERWRIVTRPDDAHRFAECHLACRSAG